MPATNFRYIKALVPIRLFNGALWMEEEDINRIPLEMFNTSEIQTAITNNQLIEVNNNDLPVDVVSPTLKWKGDWDASNGQLPIGRRIGDIFKVITPGTVGGIALVTGQLVFFRTLTDFDFLGFTNEELTASQYIFKLSGDWTPVGTLADATAIRSVDAIIGTNGTNQLLQPNPLMTGLGAIAIASSGVGIPTSGFGTVWTKVVAPTILNTDNMQEYGVYFLNESAEPEDFSIIATGGLPTNVTYGGVVTFNPTGFTSYAIVNNIVANSTSGTFASPVSPGDVLYVGFDRANNKLLVQKNTGAVFPGAILNFNGFPTGESLFVSVYAGFTSSSPVFSQGNIEFNFAATDNGKVPVQAVGSVNPPPGAEEGQEWRVVSNAIYNGYSIKTGDVVKFFNGLNDLVITRVPSVTKDDIPPGIAAIGYDSETQHLAITRVFADGHVDQLSTLIETKTAAGFVCFTDVVPQNIADNVGNKVTSSSGLVLDSCTSGTLNVRVKILAVSGSQTLMPTVTINGTPVDNLTPAEARNIWEGYLDMTLSGTQTLTALHGEGSTATLTITYEVPPVVASAVFLGNYPAAGSGQTEYAAGEGLSVYLTSATPFVAVQAQDASGTATVAFDSGIIPSTTATAISLTSANRGNVTQALPAVVRIQNATGTWSPWYPTNTTGNVDHVNVVNLNNTRPSVTYTGVTYPVGQQAIKNGDSATLGVTFANCDGVSFTSPNNQVSFSAAGSLTNQTVQVSGAGLGAYNIVTNNVRATVTRLANNTSAVFDSIVWIADVAPVVTIATASARLRSGGTHGSSPQNHVITLSSNQRLVSGVSVDASVGAWQASWSTANSGLTWTRSLQITDSDTKGAAQFSNLSVTNLAGIPVTQFNGNQATVDYTVGGLVQRTISFAAWPNRESDIGTYVVDTSKLRVTNLSKGSSGSLNTTYRALIAPDAVDRYTITSPMGTFNATGRYIYNLDLANATSNTTGLMQFEVEELV